MKKVLSVLLLGLLLAVFCFAACQSLVPAGEEVGTTQTETGTTETATATQRESIEETVSESAQNSTAAQTSALPATEPESVNTTRAETSQPTATEVPPTQPPQTDAPSQTNAMQVTLSVRCQTAVDAGSEVAEAVAPDGWILAPTAMTIAEGDTVLDVLERTDLVLGVRRSGYGSYVYSIQSLAERAVGSMSGWIYLVNGEQVQAACSACVLKDGDSVEWVYTLDGGKDVAS